MAHFRADMRGSRGEASRCGTRSSGIAVNVGSWAGGVHVVMWHDDTDDVDMVEVSLRQWHGRGTYRVLYRGRCDGEPDATAIRAVRSLA